MKLSKFYGALTGGLIVGTLISYIPRLGFIGSILAFMCFALIMYVFLAARLGEVILKWKERLL